MHPDGEIDRQKEKKSKTFIQLDFDYNIPIFWSEIY